MQAYKRYGVSTSSSAPVQVTCDKSQSPATLSFAEEAALGDLHDELSSSFLALQQSSYKYNE